MALAPYEADRELARLRRMPYGTARTAATEALTDRLDAEGPRDYLAAGLLDLVEAYVFTDADDRALVAFARLLRLWDEDASLFDPTDTANLFWEYKWVATSLSDYPQISAEQAEAFLAEMERRFVVAGKPTSCVAKSRFAWLGDTGNPQAEEARQAWRRAGFDEFDDCTACRTGNQMGYLVYQGRFAEAVEIAAEREGSCNREPHHTLVYLALAHAELGQAKPAADALAEARASIGDNHTASSDTVGAWFEALCRIGRLSDALALFRGDYARFLPTHGTPQSQLRMLTHVVAGLAAYADADDAPTGLTQLDEPSVGQFREWAHGRAAELAAQFDERNGNDFCSQLLARALTATRLDGVPVAEASAAGAVVPEVATAAESVGQPEAEVSISTSASDDEPDDAARYQAAAAADEAAGQLAEAGLNYAEAAHLSQDADRAEAHRLYALAVPRLVAGGARPGLVGDVLRAWAPVAADLLDTEAVENHLVALIETLDQLLAAASSASEDLAQAETTQLQALRCEVTDVLARTIASTPPSQRRPGRSAAEAIGFALHAGEGFARLGLTYDAAHAFWLAGRLQQEARDLEAAIWSLESAYEGFRAAAKTDAAAEAAGELIEALRASGQEQRAAEIARTL
jgi:hypothetical protein